MQPALRILMVYRGLDWQRAEGAEIRELVAGVVEAGGSTTKVLATDGQHLRDVEVVDGEVAYRNPRALSRLWREGGVDVAHVHLPIPASQVLTAARLRARGVPIVLSPMAMLGRDFATSSWFRDTSSTWRTFKPSIVAALRQLWKRLAQAYVCVSRYEAGQGSFPPERTVLAPLPAPRTPLAMVPSRPPTAADPGPVALVSRFDVHRKGIDRVCRWIAAYRDDLPRPAALLLAPADDDPPAELAALVGDGLIEWDTTTTGAALAPALARCRALMLLSRYEGMPRGLREAALFGLPIITTAASNAGEALDVLADGGFVVDGDDPRAVQQAFHDVVGQPGAPERAAVLLDRSRIGAFLLQILEDTARGRPPSAPDYYDLPLAVP